MADSESRSKELSEENLTPIPEQYEAGYAARYRDEPMSIGATRSWQVGWTDASRELGTFADMFAPAQASLSFCGTGEEARRRGLPFEPSCSEVWKRDWIETDIALGASTVFSAVE